MDEVIAENQLAKNVFKPSDSAMLLADIEEGRMTQLNLLSHVQHLDSIGEVRAACNLYALWINHSSEIDKHFALFNYAGMLQNLNRMEEALVAYETCIALSPAFAHSYINKGLLHERQGDDNKALHTWLRLINRRFLDNPPTIEFMTIALNHIGRLQETLKNYAQAEVSLEESLVLNPNQPGVIQHWVHIRQKAARWPIYKKLPTVTMAEMRRFTSPLAMLAQTDDPSEQLLCAQTFVARTYSFKEENLSNGRGYHHDRLRVGYVSADLRDHAVGFLLPGVIDGHDRNKFELFAYDFSKEEGTDLREKLKNKFDHFISIHHLSDRQVAELVLSHEIDILIDLHGLSSGARPGIFSLRPAPRQGTYLGFMGPTGMPWLDFVVADQLSLPEQLTPYFTEKPLYVAGSFLPLVSYVGHTSTVSRRDIGLPENAFVMGAFGNTYKITPEMFEVWMRLLKRIPESVLWLLDDNEECTANLKAHALDQGVTLDRLIFSPRVVHSEFCHRLSLADIYLDTYPYNCGSTSNDVINANVPLVTLYGRTLVSRMGLSLLTAIGAPGNATRTFTEYEEKVVELAIKSKVGKLIPHPPLCSPVPVGKALLDLSQQGIPTTMSSSIDVGVKNKVKIFQISYTDEMRQATPEGFMSLDNFDQSGSDWREFWPIRNFLIENTLEDDVFYGFFPAGFCQKTGLNFQKIRDFSLSHGSDHDVLIFSPHWDFNSFFINPFEQGDYFRPGLMSSAQNFLQQTGHDLRLSELVMHGDNTSFGNCFVANKKFWLHWLELGEKLYEISETPGNILSELLNQQTEISNLPQKIFIQERLVSMLLTGTMFKSKAWNMFELPPSISPLNQYKSEAILANALKLAFHQRGENLYLEEFHKLRNKVWVDSGMDKLFKDFQSGTSKKSGNFNKLNSFWFLDSLALFEKIRKFYSIFTKNVNRKADGWMSELKKVVRRLRK